jgi:hypothetical protein
MADGECIWDVQWDMSIVCVGELWSWMCRSISFVDCKRTKMSLGKERQIAKQL